MAQDDDFDPRLGKPRALGGKPQSYLSRILRSAMLASGGTFGRAPRRSGFTGARIGRGAGVGQVLISRDRLAAYRSRRVIVKFSIPKLSGKGLAAARAHMRYVQRDGVTRDGAPGQLYGADTDQANGRAFIDRAEAGEDPRQFRFIVSPEDGAEYEDLKALTRRLMARMEKDLDTKLDWVAVDHHNTGHPHTHIIVRGRDDQGGELVIAKDYLTQGLRERAAELVSLDLGPRSDRQIEMRLREEVGQERLTSLDRGLLRDVGEDGLVSPRHVDPLQHSVRAGRLQTLSRLGLAREDAPTRWRLAGGLEVTLRRMGERGDIQKTLNRALIEGGVDRDRADQVIYQPAAPGARPVVGRLVARGLSDELKDHHYLVVDGVDGRAHYVEIGRSLATEPIALGALVRVEPRPIEVRAVDQTIARIAAAHDGRYSIDLHLAHDPTASVSFAQAHVRRLEALRRGRVGVERHDDGAWTIGADHLDQAVAFEKRQAQTAPVVVKTLSALSLEAQVGADGATWLDRQLLADAPEPLRDAGFGRQARQALALRRQWLIDQGLARQELDQVIYRAGLLTRLQRRELIVAAEGLARETGRTFFEARPGQRVEGVYRRAADLASGRFAVVERSRDFTLVPWKPVLEGREGRLVSGVLREAGVSWTIGRGRDGPVIS
ncbi:conjugal transfer protein TraI [Caulobacter sp. Root1455]|uniref:relaxase/mobilization nuclease RlxS n=1 Tax=Caulobacter sp. Root1455 TaxID=1736465 RepID=UPI0007009C28|nr:relaxase/mobilization nuclease RlxS [Caulobacter sp. Root1455]KQY91820.1 conjugal transfer protein TraI [Caulobacter sp. Root1455]